jgi:hypothetical protein
MEWRMGEYTTKVAAVVAKMLEPGEVVLAAVAAAPRGAMRAIAYGHARRHLAEGRAEARAFGVPAAAQYVLALTDRRFVWFRTSLTGRPKAQVGALARGDVGGVELGTARVLGQRYTELRFVRGDGRRCTFEVARLHAGAAEALVAAFLDLPDAAAG